MYLLFVCIIPQSGVTTYAYVDCHISFDCVCRQQFSPAETCVLSRNRFSHVLLVPGYGQLSLDTWLNKYLRHALLNSYVSCRGYYRAEF